MNDLDASKARSPNVRETMPGSSRGQHQRVHGMYTPTNNTRETFGAAVEAENYFLRKDMDSLTKQLENLKLRFSYEHIKNSDASVLMYTGLPTAAIFELLFQTMDKFKLKYYSEWNVEKITKIDQCLLTLMKLRLNLPHEDLALRFNCCRATVTNIVMTWLYALHEVLFKF